VWKTPQQNGIPKRMNRSLTEKVWCLRLQVYHSIGFWAEAVNMAYYLLSQSPRASLDRKVAKFG